MPIFQQDIDKLVIKFNEYLGAFDEQKILNDIAGIEIDLSDPAIWDNHERASSLQKLLEKEKRTLEKVHKLKNFIEELEIAGELNEEELVENTYKQAEIYIDEIEKSLFLCGKYDGQDALVTIHAGAGGVDAEDWAAMVMSMYQACCKSEKWSCTVIDISVGAEGGVKTATLKIQGSDIYGLLKEEFG
jgi:peptide chain release factor 2